MGACCSDGHLVIEESLTKISAQIYENSVFSRATIAPLLEASLNMTEAQNKLMQDRAESDIRMLNAQNTLLRGLLDRTQILIQRTAPIQ